MHTSNAPFIILTYWFLDEWFSDNSIFSSLSKEIVMHFHNLPLIIDMTYRFLEECLLDDYISA